MNKKYLKKCYHAKANDVLHRFLLAKREIREAAKAYAKLNRMAREFFGEKSQEANEAFEKLSWLQEECRKIGGIPTEDLIKEAPDAEVSFIQD